MNALDATAQPPVGQLVADRNAIALLRDLQPARPLSWSEARSIAERQAALLLDLHYIREPLVPLFVITSLPGLVVDWKANWPTAGLSIRTGQTWRVVVNADEPHCRRRFSLAHEFKHVLDDPTIQRAQAHLKPHRRRPRAERLCNYFAACLLMPRPWVKHDWYGGLQDVEQLARRYYVSTEAMMRRLRELGLVADDTYQRKEDR